MESPRSEHSSVPVETTHSWLHRVVRAIALLLIGGLIIHFVYTNATGGEEASRPFQLGLDLAGGSQLIYQADVSDIEPEEISSLMSTLREVIEDRINLFGVSEPIVQVEQSSFVTDEVQHRLLVELPGVTDVSEAVEEIGRTPLLEFKLVDREALQADAAEQEIELGEDGQIILDENDLTEDGVERDEVEEEVENEEEVDDVIADGRARTAPDEGYITTGLTGRYLDSARMDFSDRQQAGGARNEPIVLLNFNREGADLFDEITANNVGEQLAIFLDGELMSSPTIRERIGGGTAVISGGFTPAEARELAQNLNFGALPIPIELVSTQTIGATLGAEVLDSGIVAGVIGFSLVVSFMLLWYRMPGIVAAVALSFYVASMLALFMLIPVTLTAAGLAGFVLSLGMAVDANVLVFERMKELYLEHCSSRVSAYEGFSRAWSAIRDGNITSLLSAIILFWFGTSLIQGFALVFGIGILVSMLTALVVTRSLLVALPEATTESVGWQRFLYHSGIYK